MIPTRHVAPESAKTQRARILGLLIDARGGWVPSPEIAACAMQYNARLYELRKLGFCIENHIETDLDTGVRRSWFRLVKELPVTAAKLPEPAPDQKPNDTGLPLFDAAVGS